MLREGPIMTPEDLTGQRAGRDPEAAEIGRLDSWKEIASFFRREVRTVQLWERHERLPVHRHQHRKVGTVHAYKSELREWWKRRCIGRDNGNPLPPEPSGALAAAPIQSPITLAVLPFEWTTPERADADLANTITGQIAARVDTGMPTRLRVTCGLAAAQRHAQGLGLEGFSSEPADYLLHGSVNSSRENLSIQVRLIRGKDECTIWSNASDYDRNNITHIHANLAEKVSRALSNYVLMSRYVIKSNAVNPAARYAYLRGRYLWSLRSSSSSMLNAMEQFRLATEIDPHHAPAFSGLADCYAVLGWLGAIPRQIAMEEARKAALAALKIDGLLAEAHVSMGCILFDFDWDWEGAEREFLLGIDLNPSYAQAFCWYGQMLVALGRNHEAIHAARIAQDMEPASPVAGLSLGSALFHNAQYDAAIQEFQHVLHMQPDHAMAHSRLGLAYEQAGDLGRAISHLKIAAEASSSDPNIQAMLAYVHARAGERGEAKKLLHRVRQLEETHGVPAIDAAAAFAALDDHDAALRYLYKGFDQRNARLTRIKCDPRLLPLHGDARFTSLTRQMRLA
jgi:tetratricopeptide (TPR) repeat protein